MYPDGTHSVCRKCGYKQKKKEKSIVVSERKTKEITFVEKKEENFLPKTKIICPKCGNDEAYWILRQMRGSDEPESRFYTCTKCTHKWRED
jgi:DNA-directed RNA polymerase subunit M